MVHPFRCQELTLAVPREIAAQVSVLTARKRVLPDGYDAAIEKFEEELRDLTGGDTLTPETWGGKSRASKQRDLTASAAVLLSFGLTGYPVVPEEEARARALAVGAGEGADPQAEELVNA